MKGDAQLYGSTEPWPGATDWPGQTGPVSAYPFSTDLNVYEALLPLRPEFRFAHEPVSSDTAGRFVGREQELRSLVQYILFSSGGSFLVTGYRGVGKTSFVNRVVSELRRALPWAATIVGDIEVLDIQMNVARPLLPAELMHHIIRRLYDRLDERRILPHLDADLRDALVLAHQRTSFNMTRKLAETTEATVGLEKGGLGAGILGAALKPTFTARRGRATVHESSFLGYDDKAAEYDLIRLSRQVALGYYKPERPWQTAVRWLFRRPRARTQIKILFVFDELDKLEDAAPPGGGHAIDEMLGALKNLFTTSGICFVFVAGRDLQERWLDDLGRGDSIYESVFSGDRYLPCMWADTASICDSLVDLGALFTAAPPPWPAPPPIPIHHLSDRVPDALPSALPCSTADLSDTVPLRPPPPAAPAPPTANPPLSADTPPSVPLPQPPDLAPGDPGWPFTPVPDDSYPLAVYRWFQKYLDFKGRGIPRRVIRGLNEYVLWTQFRPYLAFSRQDVRRFRFYAGIQEVLEASERRLFEDTPEEIRSTRHDRRRLGVYYLIDWILRQGPAEFTLQDAVNASRRLSSQIAPAEEVAPQAAQQICQMLLQNGYLEEVRPNLAEVQIGQVDAKDKRYRLAPRRLSEMNALVGAFESEIYAMQPAGALPERLGRYRIVSLEGQGGTSTVYRAWDEALGREVGLKVLRDYYALDPVGLERFHREAQVMASLRHPNIVRMYEIGQDRSNWFIAMEWVDGRSLDTLIRSLGRLDPAAALQIAIPAAGALGYVHGQGIVRNDVKPGNILISRAGQVLLTDFGISKRLDAGSAITSASLMIGTPFYMSPEQCEGLPADARSDLYALGAVLYEMVTGFPPFRGDTAFEVIMAHINQPPQPPSRAVDVPPALEAVILKCLEKDPDRRYQSMGELSQAIEASLPDRPEVDLASLVGTVDAQARRVAETDQARTEVGAGAGLNSGSLEPEAGVSEPVQVPPHAPAPPAVAASPAKPPVPNALTPRPSIGAPQAAPVLAAGIPRPTEAPDVFSAQPPPAPHEAETAGLARHPSLEIVGSGEHPQVFRFPPKAVRIRIGRVSDSDLVLTELKVSRHHAAIECREGIWTIEDLNTANGTFLNGYRIVEQAPLAPGDRIGIGEAVLIFR